MVSCIKSAPCIKKYIPDSQSAEFQGWNGSILTTWWSNPLCNIPCDSEDFIWLHHCLPSKRLGVDPWVRKILWRRKWQPTPVFLPGKFHGQRSLVGYSPRGCTRVRHNLATERACSNLTKKPSSVFTSVLLKKSHILWHFWALWSIVNENAK